MTSLKTVGCGTLLAALCLLTGALFPALCAGYGIVPGSVQLQTLDKEGNPDTRAGAHPDRLLLDFELDTEGEKTGPRDFAFDFAPGLAGSPIATPICSRVDFEINDCPSDTRVGVFRTELNQGLFVNQTVFNLSPAPGQLATLGFKLIWQTELAMEVSPNDFGIRLSTKNLVQLPLRRTHVEIWGVPADYNEAKAPVERAAFMTMPTDCSPLKIKFFTRSWKPGAPVVTEDAESQPFTGCQDLPFEPDLDIDLTNPKPDSPTGARIDINLAENTDPDELVNANLKQARIDFPPGFTVSPASVEGREFCEDDQFGLGTNAPAACPYRSRVGLLKMSTTQLPNDLEGSIFLGRERPGDRFPLLVFASAPGVAFKAAANLVADPQTGQLSITLKDLPRFSIDQISMDLEGGPRALLATPLSCGQTTASARFVSYSGGPAVDKATPVNVDSSCGNMPFAIGMAAGSTELSAGRSTDFSVTLTRQDGEQLLKRYSTTLPLGLSPNLTTVGLCPASAAGAGACPESSRIGSAVAEVGSGLFPAKLPGTVFLTEGFEGAPYGLAMKFGAAIGPYDLGALNLRATIRIDSRTGQASIGQALPTIFEGVPLRFRTIGVDLSRPGFLVNPTSCEPQRVTATITSVDGRTLSPSVPFGVGGCDSLGFRPKFSVALDRRGRKAKKPELSFAVNVPKGDANVDRVKVKFARTLEFHNAALKEICARGDAAEDRCRPGSRVGTAAADSPLLATPLRGPVYVVQPKGGGFPDLWGNIESAGVKLQLRSESSGKNGNLTTEMVEIPDLPLGTFTMRITGGVKKDSFFTIGKDPCGSPGALMTAAELESQNGTTRTINARMKADCSKSGGKKRIPSKGRAPHRE
ncbi:MAG TPA: hypothetical protein VFI03_06690 [Solirubrobacterales bacterium]|nr:hypothetical protein [Solirubrobacterales bacterium]